VGSSWSGYLFILSWFGVYPLLTVAYLTLFLCS
uniref:Uncharacterized protein n=1 Tax=Amphimedon queenslandica TaxID=400682 RepID=A0A1X7UFP2_AMPQE